MHNQNEIKQYSENEMDGGKFSMRNIALDPRDWEQFRVKVKPLFKGYRLKTRDTSGSSWFRPKFAINN